MKPKQKQAKKDQYKARRELHRNTLHKNSMAMGNPFYNLVDDSPWGLFLTCNMNEYEMHCTVHEQN